MKKVIYVLILALIVVSRSIFAEVIKTDANDTIGPKAITRNIIQDKKGNIWMAAFDGVFKYDGKVFTHVTAQVSPARFFSILEDSKGVMWFGSIGSGVYRYDGRSFKNFTIKDGLLSNNVGSIYEDKKGYIWFGAFGGASRYDGRSFRNFIIDGEAMAEDHTGKTFSSRPQFEVNAIIEDKAGKFWFATRNNTFVYDGKTFAVFAHQGKPFKNVRTLIQDSKDNIWLGGADGLWRYDGSAFTNFTPKFTGYIMEDKRSNIWTSSESDDRRIWAVSRYDAKTLTDQKPRATAIANNAMTFGILEDTKGNIWFGALGGVNRYDGSTLTSFNIDAPVKTTQPGKPLGWELKKF